ncbi:hypothetical protein FQA39_LY03093 [Lamprigera yunnana]|nr:hypothetical protein FQA39_LY03093 [Lamprigera yunnana]
MKLYIRISQEFANLNVPKTRIRHSDNIEEDYESRIVQRSRRRRFKLSCLSRLKRVNMTENELSRNIHTLNKCCLLHMDDSYKVHMNRLKGIDLVNDIVNRGAAASLSVAHVSFLIYSTLSCVHHFYICLKTNRGLMAWIRRRQARKAFQTYEDLIHFCLPQNGEIVRNTIIEFFNEARIWNIENLYVVETKAVDNSHEARQVIQVLYQILENFPWRNMDEYLIPRLLVIYSRSIIPTDNVFHMAPLHKGIELTLMHVFENIPGDGVIKVIKLMIDWVYGKNVSDDALLQFGSLIQFAAGLHNTYLYRHFLDPNLFSMILELIASENRLYSLLGNRIFQNLLDRHHNISEFSSPKIFFSNLRFNVVIGQYSSEDKSFIRVYRETIHDSLMAAIKHHGNHRINLETTYTSIAIVLVEVPCGYTAAVMVCLAMAIQESAIKNENLELLRSHWQHATVMAIMSLVCYIHNAQVFYEYLQKIIKIRSKLAPHLNPPILPRYQYASHYVLWNKPELFFENWEARYGLWKCFRTRKARASTMIDTRNLFVANLESSKD